MVMPNHLIYYKFNNILTLALNFAFEIITQSLDAFKFFILKEFVFFMLTSTFALDKTYLLSIKLSNLLAMVAKLLDCDINFPIC
jgi:hypothetical protein